MKTTTATRFTRRQFLRRAAAAIAAPMIIPGSVLGLNGAVAPSNRIVFGGIGLGNRARATLPNFLSFKEVQYLAVSDSRRDRLKNAKDTVDTHYGNKDCLAFPDFRELLARPDIDAVSIATGNRWHSMASMFASRAGKDIYCEKPISLTIREGRNLVETCRRLGTIYQAGTQRRSTASYRFARDMVLQGKIGRVHTVESGASRRHWTRAHAVEHRLTALCPPAPHSVPPHTVDTRTRGHAAGSSARRRCRGVRDGQATC